MFRLQLVFFLLLTGGAAAQQPKLAMPTGHGISIIDMALSYDGKYVATASDDRTIILWETETGRQIHTLAGHTAYADNVWFSNDDKTIYSASREEHAFFSWDKETGILRRKTTLEGGTLAQIKLSDSNNCLYTTGFDGYISCYDLNTGKKRFRIQSYKSVIETLEFSTDESKFIIASDDGVKELSAADGKLLREFPVKPYMMISAYYTTDNKKILVSSIDSVGKNGEKRNQSIVKVFDAASGKFLEDITGADTRFEVQYAANGSNRIILDYYNSSLTLLKIQGGDTLFTTPVSYRSFGFIGTEKKDQLYTVNNNELSIWDAVIGKKINSVSLPFKKVNCVKPVMNGTFLLIGSGENGMSVLQEIKTGKEKTRLTGQSFISYYPKFSPDGNFIYNLSTDFTIKKWNKSTGRLDKVFRGHSDFIIYHRLLKQENRMLTVGLDGSAIVWDTRLSAPLFVLELPKVSESDKYELNDEGTRMIGRVGHTFIRIWDIENGTDHKDIIKPDANIRDIALSPDGKKLAVTSWDTVAFIIDVATGNILQTCRQPGVEGSKLCFSPDNSKLLLLNWSTTFVMDVATGKMLGQTKTGNESLMPGKYSADGSFFITQSHDSTIHVWRSSDISMISTLRFTEGVPVLSFFDSRNRLITQSSDNLTRLWDIQTGKVLQTFKGPMGGDVNRTADTLVTAYNNEWMLYSMADGKLIYKSLIMGDDNLVLDEKGRYDGNEVARKLVYLTCGTEIIELDQVKDQLWIPDLAGRLLKGETIGSKTIDELGICELTPKVERVQNIGSAYHFKIIPRRGGLGETVLYVNGIESGRYKPAELKQTATGYELLVVKESLTSFFIAGQENTVTAKAYTSDNAVSSRGAVVTSKENKTATAPNLYAIMIGVSDYKGSELDLKYAAKDANDISAALAATARKLFNINGNEHVFLYNLTTEKDRYLMPEKNNIKKTIAEIAKKTTSNDVLLLFFAGHGVMAGEADKKQFYFLTADASTLASTAAVKDVGISTTELTEWMKPQNIKAQKRILVFDACNSGQAIKDFVKMGGNDQQYMAARSDDKSQLVKAIDKLNEKSGLFILSASASDQSAYEMGRYSQGLLTYSLLKAIKEQPDILEDGKYLNVSRWFNAAEKTVNELAKETGARQQPQIVSTTNFNIGIVDEEVMAKIVLPQEKPLFAASNFQNSDEAVADDDLELSKMVNLQLSDLATRGSDSKIVYVTATNSPDAWSLSGRYTVKGNSITAQVNVKQSKAIKHRFEINGTMDKLKELATAITEKAAEMVK